MNEMTIVFDDDANHYEFEMHEISGERLRQYILNHPDEDFQSCVMMCGEMVQMYPIDAEVSA